MSDVKTPAEPGDEFLDELEKTVRGMMRNRKTSKADKLAAINAGIKIAAIRHKILGGDEKGFFEK